MSQVQVQGHTNAPISLPFQVQEEHERRIAEAAMLERHIMQAQARAMSADERALNRLHASSQGFPDLGLPPRKNYNSNSTYITPCIWIKDKSIQRNSKKPIGQDLPKVTNSKLIVCL